MRAVVCAVAMLIAMPASAQTFARRRVPAGEVTGLEMGIDGSLTVAPGGRVRWYLTIYEVVRRRDLRPAGRATVRVYGPALTPYERVLAAGEVSAAQKAQLRALHGQLNPFQLAREIERQKRVIEAQRLLPA